MKVLYFVGTLGAGGLERFVTRVCVEASKTEAFEPMVCCLHDKSGLFLDDLNKAQVQVFQAPENWARNIKQLIRFRKLIQDIRPDIIHSMVNFSLFQQSLLVLFQKGSKLFVTERNCYNLKGWNKWRRQFQYRWLKLIGVNYSANGVNVAQHLASLVKVKPSSIQVIPNGIKPIPANEYNRNKIRAQLKVRNNELLLGCIARFADQKGHFLLIDAINLIVKEGYKVKLVLIGDGPLRQKIQAHINELGLQENILFCGIIKNTEEYLQAMDLFILLSEREGMPNVILEAMAAGKPIVATTVGSIPELIHDNQTGVLLTNPTPQTTAEKLVTLMKHPEMMERMALAAKVYVLENYGIDQVMTKLRKLYNL